MTNEYAWSLTLDDDPQHLAHYGIKGMKWGVRRYQNTDGSYTKED